MKKKHLFSLIIIPAIVTINPTLPTLSQNNLLLTQTTQKTIDTFQLNRAKNVARQTAEKENGGLSKYRAESSMHGPAFNTPHKINDDGSITFSFYGSKPSSSNYSYESVITVYLKDFQVEIEYNGAVRKKGN
jgi:hypothetical protein